MTGTDAATVGTLTADDIAAFKMADGVVLIHRQGAGVVRLILDAQHATRIYTAREQRLFTLYVPSGEREREITTQSGIRAFAEDCGTAWNSGSEPDAYAFQYSQSAKYDDTWPTLVNLLRVGDVVSLSWVADDNYEAVRRAGLHTDEARLIVTRGKRRMNFHVHTSTGPDIAVRMIRRSGSM